MNTETWIVIAAIVVLALIALAVWVYIRQYRSQRLKTRFGPEYDRTLSTLHDRRLAEAELRHREERAKLFRIVSLSEADRTRYEAQWLALQEHFVDEPKTAVEQAHSLILEVMEKRGYPSGDFEQTAADLSVNYPKLVADYRAAHAIAENNRRGTAKTEDLRQAVIHYRSLFEALLRSGTAQSKTPDARAKTFRPAEEAKPAHKGGLRT